MKYKSETDTSDDYFYYQKFIFRCLGLSVNDEGTLYAVYRIAVLVLISIHLFCASFDCIVLQTDYDEKLINILFVVASVVACIKYIIVLIKRPKLKNIFCDLQNDLFVPNFEGGDGTEEKWVKDCLKFIRKLIFVYTGLVVSTAMSCSIVYYAMERSKGTHMLPFGSVSLLTEHCNYVLVLLYQNVAILLMSITYVLSDITYVGVLESICVQCKILQYHIKRMTDVSNVPKTQNRSDMASTSRSEFLKKSLRKIIYFHAITIQISKQVEEAFTWCIFTEFTGLSVSTCLIIYSISLLSGFSVSLARNVAALINLLAPLFIVSYWGNKVMIESLAVADACYKVDFVGTDTVFQKDLMLVMLRSQRPITLTVGKFTVLSLGTMLSFCQTCYTYYMFLTSMNN